jgi:eukaryotic-like serine/threonine-protein kinase
MPHDDAPETDVLTAAAPVPLVEGLREIGPYKLLAVLGEGGMGLVYLAEQTAPIRRRVALKILKPGMDTHQVIARFESERQALAVMDHGNIAKVFDSGVTPSGRPFFVMELAHGTPITEYADTHCLSTTERLRLFIDVCRAVQHAHHKGVIHRDLKPSNVLVTVAEDGATVKVIDFGIAKAVGIGLTERTLVTRVGQMIGTPEYMSPEQAEMSGLDVDTRTDVYSLGVMLYELLVGALPYDLAAKPDYVIPHALREREVLRPSLKLSGLGDSVEALARCRRTTPDALRRELRGDLDWIILKAMEKDRTRRYDTPNGLAADVERYLRHEVVVARPPSAAYRLGKFVRRNRVPVAAAAVAALSLAAGAGAAATGMVRAQQEQARAEAAALEARLAAETSENVVAFMVDLFGVVDPSEARGSTITAREVLDRGATRIRTELRDEPLVQFRLLDAIGTVYQRLGLYPTAAATLEEAVSVVEHTAGRDELGLARARTTLGGTYRSLRRFSEAEAVLQAAVDNLREADATETREYANAVRSLGNVLQVQGRWAEAEPLLQEALQVQLRVLGPWHRDVGATYSNLGALAYSTDRLDDAEEAFRQAVAVRERALAPDDPELGTTLSNLAAIYFARQRYTEAEAEYARAADLMERGYGELHPKVGQILSNLGEVKWARGRFEEAEPLLRRSLVIKEATAGSEAATVAVTLRILADVYRDQRRFAEAEPLYRRAVQINEAAAASPRDAGRTFESYARLLRQAGRTVEAREEEKRAAALPLGPPPR